jgi:hypothetical protein
MSLFHSHSHFKFKGSPSFFLPKHKKTKKTNKQKNKHKNEKTPSTSQMVVLHFLQQCFVSKQKQKKTENKLTKQI